MNFVFVSPHFPPNYLWFCVELRRLGVDVYGIADAPYERLRSELRQALTEYYRVEDLHDYEQVLRACGYFTHRHGKIDRVESHNEHWLTIDARLRADFNVPGLPEAELAAIQRKSRMKERFLGAGVPVARGGFARDLDEGRRIAEEVGYPLVAKPDVGAGASGTWRIADDRELVSFYDRKQPVDYVLEELIAGSLQSFDGMTDQDGRIVFEMSHVFSRGIMEAVNADEDLSYYSLREIPADVEDLGRRAVSAFDLRERFFHFELFRSSTDGRLVAIELNARPPGGWTTDMFNYANDIDVYHEWANVVVHNRFTATYARPFHCCYAGRKRRKRYAHGHEQIFSRFGRLILHHGPIDAAFRGAIGDYGYLARSPLLEEVLEVAAFIQEEER
jgi:phosphoribosylaminoimidazole carboxylase (NCAIR synthetase)